jgi:hypothetical protein
MGEDIMATCLNEIEIRVAADGEADSRVMAHVESCPACRARVTTAVEAAAELSRMAGALPVPTDLEARVLRAADRQTAGRAGATTLRAAPARTWTRPAWISGLALAGAVLAFVVFMPVSNAPTTLSASEILGRSLEAWGPGRGTELLEFDLTVDLPAITGIESGTYRVEQLIDHDTPGRYRVARYAPSGALVGAVSEDVSAGRRAVLMPTRAGTFAFTFAIQPQHGVGLRDLERHHVQAVLRLLQAMASNTVTETGEGHDRRYVVELPPVANAAGQKLWQLASARVVIDAESFEVHEAQASGTYMNEPFSLSFALRQREVRPTASVPASEFDLPSDSSAIVIDAAGTDNVGHDIMMAALEELARHRASTRP